MSDGSDGDPVAANADRVDRDLYDVTEWERRTVVDRLASGIARAIGWGVRGVLVALALVLLVAQLGAILYAMTVNPGLGVLTLLSIVPAFLLVGLIWWGDPEMREPVVPLSVTFLLAVLFASFAALVNSALQPLFAGWAIVPQLGMILFFFLVVGPIEEVVKLLAVGVYAYESDAFDTVVDGAVYGAVAGLGFATIENALYITQDVLGSGGVASIQPFRNAASTAVTRGFVGPGHVIYSSFAGYYLGLAKFNRDDWGTVVVKGLLIAVAIHATYNSIVTYAPFGALGGGLVTFVAFILLYDGLFGYVLYRKLSRYRDAYSEAVGESDAPTGDPRSG